MGFCVRCIADSLTSSISSFKDSELLTIFPNPASDYLIIEYLQMDSGEDYQISIYNNFGQLVLSQSY